MSDQIVNTQLSGFSNIYGRTFGIGKKAKNITFIVTEGCNLRCTYCYEKGKNGNNRMSLETAKNFVDLLFEEDMKNSQLINEKEASALILDFIGGEPLLEIDLIDDIMKYFLDKAIRLKHRWAIHYMISISTNGIEYFNPKVQDFINRYGGRLSISITIDGNKKLHDACRLFPDGRPSFDIVDKAFKHALAHGYLDGTKMTLAQANIKYLADAIINLSNYEGVKMIPANFVFEEDWTLDDAKVIYSEMKKLADHFIENKKYTYQFCTLFDKKIGMKMEETDNRNWCGGTGSMLACSPKGIIYPCLRYAPFALTKKDGNDMILGDIKNGLLSKEEHKQHYSCLECITRKSQSSEKCYDCPIAKGCAWCSAWNYDYYGTPNKRYTGICNAHKARVLANAYYWNTLYRKLNMPDRFGLFIPKEWALEIIDNNEWNQLQELSKFEQEGYNDWENKFSYW